MRLRAYYDSHPSADSRLTLDPASKNRYGDPMPKIDRQLDAAAAAREGATLAHCTEVFERMAKASNGRLVGKPTDSNYWDHPAGGCRMGDRSGDERVRQLRPHARSREPVRDRRADAADRRLHQRHADVRGGVAAIGQPHRRGDVNRRLGVLISGRGSNLKAIIDAIERRSGSTRRSRS